MIINDPECPVLVELKNKSKSEYYQAVHTAYLSDKIAKRLGLDNMAAKTCGYYHKIGTLRGENSWEAIHKVCQEYRFPAPAVALLKEYTDRESSLTSKEAIVVLFADTLVASLLYIFSKDPTVKPDYDQIIDAVYEKKLESGIIDKSMVTVGDMKVIRQMLKEEHLYYDFLR
jgi:membrane-associated HD superfamily phosphohydrolase